MTDLQSFTLTLRLSKRQSTPTTVLLRTTLLTRTITQTTTLTHLGSNLSLLYYIHKYLPTYLHTYLPTYLPTYIPTYLPTYLPTHLPTYLRTRLPTHLPTLTPTYLHTCLPTDLHTCIPILYTHLPFSFLNLLFLHLFSSLQRLIFKEVLFFSSWRGRRAVITEIQSKQSCLLYAGKQICFLCISALIVRRLPGRKLD